MKIYCEHGSLTREIRKLAGSGNVELVHFPYDPDSHTHRIRSIAALSDAQIRDLNLPVKDLPGAIADISGSDRFDEICSIIGAAHRRDILHVDSAYKSGCSAFLTQDKDILKHRTQLEEVLGIRFFNPSTDTDLCNLRQFVADRGVRR